MPVDALVEDPSQSLHFGFVSSGRLVSSIPDSTRGTRGLQVWFPIFGRFGPYWLSWRIYGSRFSAVLPQRILRPWRSLRPSTSFFTNAQHILSLRILLFLPFVFTHNIDFPAYWVLRIRIVFSALPSAPALPPYPFITLHSSFLIYSIQSAVITNSERIDLLHQHFPHFLFCYSHTGVHPHSHSYPHSQLTTHASLIGFICIPLARSTNVILFYGWNKPTVSY